MGCCCSTPTEPRPQDKQIGMSTLNMVVPPDLVNVTPIDSEKSVRQTSKIEVDSLQGNTFVNQYLIIKNLGSGSFGTVKLCLSMDNSHLYALKVVRKKDLRKRLLAGRRKRTDIVEEDMLREISVMQSLEHPNVVRLFEVIDDPADDKLIMVMEYVEGGSVVSEEQLMASQHGFMSEDDARMHFRDLIKGLDYLHYQNVIHRDLKTENLLLTETGCVKIADFGSACRFQDGNDTVYDTCGTRTFFAPEMCSGDGRPYAGKKADIYAAGVCLYVMLFQRLPFEADNPGELFEKIQTEEPSYAGRDDISPHAMNLMKRLLKKNPHERLTLEAIMQHEWFTDSSSLKAIKSSRVLSVPTIHEAASAPESAVTPSIISVFQQIPGMEVRHFRKGSYIVREGDQLTGFYLIKKGMCIMSSNQGRDLNESSMTEGDLDFQDAELDGVIPEEIKSAQGSDLLHALSQPSERMADTAIRELARFQTFDRSDVVKGMGRRTTYQHTRLKELVETAAAVSASSPSHPSGKSRRGPGSIIGLDLAVEQAVSRHTIVAVEPVDAFFVQKLALDQVFSGSNRQLQLRLLVAKLQKIELLKDTVQKLADLRPDFLQMEQLRALVRNVSVVS